MESESEKVARLNAPGHKRLCTDGISHEMVFQPGGSNSWRAVETAEQR